jgi:hypothetical protein
MLESKDEIKMKMEKNEKKKRWGAGEEKLFACAVLGFQTVQILKSILYTEYTKNSV